MNREKVAILDSNSVTGQGIAKRIRGKQVYCALYLDGKPEDCVAVMVHRRDAERFSGGRAGLPWLVYDEYTEDAALETFLFQECGLSKSWTVQAFIADQIARIREQVGARRVLLALSGGVDSSVCAVLLQKAVGKQLKCIFVDHGLMRKDEPRQIETIFKKTFDIDLKCVSAEARFLEKLKGVADPEQKRKMIGGEFIRVFEEEARALGRVEFLAQGTIYPDVIESGIGSGLVKSHHNVGGMPEKMEFTGLIEPLRELFKDEVRKVGEALDIPRELVYRQPFPGPGLGVRCLGELTKRKLDRLREADAIFCEEMKNEGLDTAVWQYFTVLLDCKSTGVKDEKRVYGDVVALRAVNTLDAMSASAAPLPYPLLERVSRRIAAEVQDVSRVVWDMTPKPPATIEWE